MARKPRFSLPGIPQHIIQRGNNRTPCFFSTEDCHRYLDDLSRAAADNHCRLHAYVLMTNHVHILATPMVEHGITHLMQDLGRRYVRYINDTQQRSGTLWEGRYKSSLIDSERYLFTCMRYIELNPVRAQMVKRPVEYTWSSYRHNAGPDHNPLLTEHPLYLALGSDAESRRHHYRELFRQGLDDQQLHNIRNTVNQELVLGTEAFKDHIEAMTKRQTRKARMGRPPQRIEESPGEYYFLLY